MWVPQWVALSVIQTDTWTHGPGVQLAWIQMQVHTWTPAGTPMPSPMDICGPVASEVQAAAMNSINSIAQHLGLGSLDFNITPATQGVLTIKKEYDKYVSVEREQGDPLVFWRVCFFCVNDLILID